MKPGAHPLFGMPLAAKAEKAAAPEMALTPKQTMQRATHHLNRANWHTQQAVQHLTAGPAQDAAQEAMDSLGDAKRMHEGTKPKTAGMPNMGGLPNG